MNRSQQIRMNKTHLNNSKRAVFATKIGAVATTAGAAVGLGNIWRFPYECGVHGGGAFMLCYIFFIIILGLPVICSEFVLGRAARSNEFRAFGKFSNGKIWKVVPIMNIVASVMIISFYSVIAGWTTYYFVESLIGEIGSASNADYHENFGNFISSPFTPLIFTYIFLMANNFVMLKGVTKGIEKASNILMPMLFLLVVAFCINSLLMPEAKTGLDFLFKPDFSKITPRVILGALGQAFFSLSIGLGCLLTYASYFSSKTNLGKTAVTTAGVDTLVAILSGIIIFPAVFSFGVSSEQGPTLVFEVLPSIFNQLPLGQIWATLFFFLLMVASITSTISMSEISISYFSEEFKMKRHKATWLSTFIAIFFGTFCCLSFGPLKNFTLFDMTIFDIFNTLSSDIILPLGGMCVAIFVGWILPKNITENQLTNNGKINIPIMKPLIFAIRWIAPIGVGLVLLNSFGII